MKNKKTYKIINYLWNKKLLIIIFIPLISIIIFLTITLIAVFTGVQNSEYVNILKTSEINTSVNNFQSLIIKDYYSSLNENNQNNKYIYYFGYSNSKYMEYFKNINYNEWKYFDLYNLPNSWYKKWKNDGPIENYTRDSQKSNTSYVSINGFTYDPKNTSSSVSITIKKFIERLTNKNDDFYHIQNSIGENDNNYTLNLNIYKDNLIKKILSNGSLENLNDNNKSNIGYNYADFSQAPLVILIKKGQISLVVGLLNSSLLAQL